MAKQKTPGRITRQKFSQKKKEKEDAMANNRFITAAQLAKRLDVSEDWIRKLTSKCNGNAPEIPFIKFGKLVRYDWASIERWLKSKEFLPKGMYDEDSQFGPENIAS